MRYLFILLFFGCANFEVEKEEELSPEPILRHSLECNFVAKPPKRAQRDPYPWELRFIKGQKRITKEYFRCKGSSFHEPRKMVNHYGETIYCQDCGGLERHSLPLKEDKEFIYPILIDLLNYLQEKTRKKVVITCGHRCPLHNTYADVAKEATYSKHLIGAEVDFYLEGMEKKPFEVAQLIRAYYEGRPKEYSHFFRYQKRDSHVKTNPWYNKEIFLKVYAPNEGRDLDNTHPYPYLSIQVRHDGEKRVLCTWQDAFSGYMRW